MANLTDWTKATRASTKHRLKKRGIVNPWYTAYEARRAGLPLAIACALLDQESGGGYNVFGHDPVKPPQIKGGWVTKERYTHYKVLRKQGYGMQGVGPVQLTWWEFQDLADKYGGCWKVQFNMRVGFEHAAAMIKQYGERNGLKRYNGTGPAAERYAVQVMGRVAIWRTRFKGD